MHVLVTGAAGFIGSHLVERLLGAGHRVSGIDCFDPYYDRSLKEANLAGARAHADFRLFEVDLARDPLSEAVSGVEAVVHLAAIPGVRGSWGEQFGRYLDNNVLATQRLLESLRGADLDVFVYGSSASIYGDEAVTAVDETWLPAPHSPYGVTKLAAEHLVHLYRRVHGLPTMALRIFSCYGERERPDKAIQKFLLAARAGRGIEVYGDGSQQRDFTYVGDIVTGLVTALERKPIGESINLARGRTRPLSDVLLAIEQATGQALDVRYSHSEAGDVRVTHARIDKAERLLAYAPTVDLEEGIARQWAAVQALPTDS